jgi:DNA-binding NarL/FixJ family response regulator
MAEGAGSLAPTDAAPRVLPLLREAQPNKLTARAPDTAEGTDKVHARRILKMLNAAHRSEAALVAQRLVS